jgi:phytoene synthase
VAGPLAVAIRAGALDPADLAAMADAREAETEELPFPTREGFHAYLRGTAGRFAIAAGRLLGAPAEALPGLEARGVAYGAAGVLRAAPALARQGRCLLPADLLAAHGLSAEAAARDPGAPAWRALARDLLDGGGLAAPPAGRLPAAWIAAALPAVLARRDARRLRRSGLAAPPRPGRPLADRLAVTWAALRRRA